MNRRKLIFPPELTNTDLSMNPNLDEIMLRMNEMAQRIADQEAIIQHLQQSSTPVVTTTNPAPVVRFKVNNPELFTGRRDKTTNFLFQCRLVFQANSGWQEQQKVTFAATYLRDAAFTWFFNLSKAGQTFTTFESFETLLLQAFGETDLVEKSKNQLRRLRQTKSCAQYSTEFNNLVALIGYSDQVALIDLYSNGLKENVKDLLLNFPKPTTVHELQSNAIDCDERLYQRELTRRSNIKPTYISRNNATPMEINAINTHQDNSRRVSPVEKQRRKDNNLCPYDGDSNCPGRDNLDLCTQLRRKSGNGSRPHNGPKSQ